MDGAELNAGFAGRTVTGEYADGLAFTETYWRDGGISYEDGRQSDKGRWAIVGDQLCTFYQSMTGGCFRLRAMGSNCYQGYLAAHAPPQPDESVLAKHLVAQFWRAGSASTCPPPPSV